MLVCSYCGRNFKNEYEVCPGCGSHSFKKISSIDEMVIKKPPEGGYTIKTTSYEKSKSYTKIFKWIGIALIVFMILFDIPFIVGGILSYDADSSFAIQFILISSSVSLIFVLIGIVFIVASRKMKKKTDNDIKRVNQLAKTGMLIKNLPYELVPSGTVINGVPVYCIKVVYEVNGTEIPFVSNPKYSRVLGDKDGSADLLLDPNDFSNFYVDFEIY